MPLYFNPVQQESGSSGASLSGAKLYFYTSGTTTDKTVYQDSTLSTPHAQPVVADATGRFDAIYMSKTTYKVVLKDSADVTIWTVDPYVAEDSVATYSTYTDLRNASPDTGDIAYLLGYSSAGDGGGGYFRWDGASSATHNGGTIIQLAAGGTGRWLRIYSGYVEPAWFGAVDDGATDSTTAFSAALGVGSVKLRSQSYVIETITVASTRAIVSEEKPTLKHKANASSGMFVVTSAASFTLDGITFDGNKTNLTTDRDIVTLTSCTDFVARNCTFADASKRTVGGGVTGKAHFVNCTITGSDDYPIQISGSNDMLVEGCTITFPSTGTPTGANVRAIQPTSVTNFRALGNYISTGRKYRDGIWMTGVSYFTIAGNTIEETEDDQVSCGECLYGTITGNSLSGSNTTGGVVLLDGGNGVYNQDISIVGNTISDGAHGIYIFLSKRIIVSANTIYDFENGVICATASPSDDLLVSANTMFGITVNAVDVGATPNVIVANNKLRGSTGTYGVTGTVGSTIIARGNDVSGFTTFYNTTYVNFVHHNTTGVGINTNNPAASLHLLKAAALNFLIESTASAPAYVQMKNTDRDWSLGCYAGGKFQISDNTAGAYRVAIDSTGQTGFKTTSPSYTVDVNGTLNCSGALSKGSGTFLIDHPLDPENKDLYHGFVEAPRYDLIYRGRVKLDGGKATVSIDAVSRMTPGTFAALTQQAEVSSLCNRTGFTRVRASEIIDGTFTITSEDDTSTDEVSWIVMAERADAFIRYGEGTHTDEDGRMIPEWDKPEYVEQ
jgi:parallel beta-helix repeat protein